jgi:hypothetical protein
MALDTEGDIYAVGSILGTQPSRLGEEVVVRGCGPKSNTLIMKYDNSGRTLWAQSTGPETTGESKYYSVAVDDAGNAYAVGTIRGLVGFTSETKVQGKYEGENLLLVKYDSQGEEQWVRTLARSDGLSAFNSAAVNKEGNVFLCPDKCRNLRHCSG